MNDSIVFSRQLTSAALWCNWSIIPSEYQEFAQYHPSATDWHKIFKHRKRSIDHDRSHSTQTHWSILYGTILLCEPADCCTHYEIGSAFSWPNETRWRIGNENKHAFVQIFTFVEFLWMRLINWLEMGEHTLWLFLFCTFSLVSFWHTPLRFRCMAHDLYAKTLLPLCIYLYPWPCHCWCFILFTSTRR